MSNVKIESFKKLTLTNENITLSYDSSDEELALTIDRKLGNGEVYHTDYLRLHPSYIDPLVDMLNKIKAEI